MPLKKVLFSIVTYMSLLTYCLFAQSLCYTVKIILGISTICLWLFLQYASTLNEKPIKSTDSYIRFVEPYEKCMTP